MRILVLFPRNMTSVVSRLCMGFLYLDSKSGNINLFSILNPIPDVSAKGASSGGKTSDGHTFYFYNILHMF